ncbi:hypothetical protein [Silvimonas soli]|uniref:hypothetical protein n=1 Tax=Silvimonas soli TaxID=2980100 RepID=UPI0024B321EF|nr:hypothetical protein [Silvimonas soli]
MRVWVAFAGFAAFFFLAIQVTGPWRLGLSDGSVAVLGFPWQTKMQPALANDTRQPVVDVNSLPEPVVAVSSAQKSIAAVPADVQYTQGSGAVAIKCRDSAGHISYEQGSCPQGSVFTGTVSGADMNVADPVPHQEQSLAVATSDSVSPPEIPGSKVLVSSDAIRDMQCDGLGRAKRFNEVQRRSRSDSSMIAEHTRIIREMDNLHCPAHFF